MKLYWNRFWRDKHGNIVIFQSPNIPLIIWFIASVLGRLTSTGQVHDATVIISGVALIVWSLLEITSGVTYFRRFMGLLILISFISQYT